MSVTMDHLIAVGAALRRRRSELPALHRARDEAAARETASGGGVAFAVAHAMKLEADAAIAEHNAETARPCQFAQDHAVGRAREVYDLLRRIHDKAWRTTDTTERARLEQLQDRAVALGLDSTTEAVALVAREIND